MGSNSSASSRYGPESGTSNLIVYFMSSTVPDASALRMYCGTSKAIAPNLLSTSRSNCAVPSQLLYKLRDGESTKSRTDPFDGCFSWPGGGLMCKTIVRSIGDGAAVRALLISTEWFTAETDRDDSPCTRSMLGERAAVPDVTTHALALSKPATDFAAAVSAL